MAQAARDGVFLIRFLMTATAMFKGHTRNLPLDSRRRGLRAGTAKFPPAFADWDTASF